MPNPREIAGSATFKMLALPPQGRIFVGTVFAISDRMVITCRHVKRDADNAGNAVLDGGPLGQLAQIDWRVHEAPELDVALGILPNATFSNWLTPRCTDVGSIESKLSCIGYCSDEQGVGSWQDHVAREEHLYGLVALQNSVHKGCSGGPVLDDAGQPVALTVARHMDAAAKYVLPFQSFYEWMQKQGFRPEAVEVNGHEQSQWLLSVPIGPTIALHEIPREVIDAFATTLAGSIAATNFLAQVNATILANNPEGFRKKQIILGPGAQPAFNVPEEFWSSVFSILGMKSRRSVAALLEAEGGPNQFAGDAETQDAFSKFKEYLQTPPHP